MQLAFPQQAHMFFKATETLELLFYDCFLQGWPNALPQINKGTPAELIDV